MSTKGLQDIEPKAAYGVKPTQTLDNFTEIFEQAEVSNPLLGDAGNAITTTLQEKFPGTFDDVRFSQGPPKEWNRSVIKLLSDEGNDLDPSKGKHVVDLVRGRID